VSDIKELPNNWKWKGLGDLCNLFCDGNWIESKDQSNSGIRLIQVGNIGKGIFIEKNESKRFISEKTFTQLNCTEVLSGDILISRLPDPVGRACIVPPLPERMITAVDCTIARVNTNLCDKQFILYCLSSDDYFTQVNTLLAGATRKRISRTNLESIEIPLPSIIEQKRIAYIIERKLISIEKIIKINIEQKKYLEKLFNSYMEEFFNPDNSFEKIKLADIAETVTKGTTPTTLGFEFENTGVNFIKIESITENGQFLNDIFKFISKDCHKALSRSQLRKNDILFSIAGALGRVALVTDEVLPANINQALSIIRIPEGLVDYHYMYFALKSSEVLKQFEKQKRGNSQKNLSLEDIKNLIIPFPSISEQQHISNVIKTILNSIEKINNLLNEQSSYIHALSSSILRKAFNGEY
jgi:type I restriction enzyme S subunit